VAKSLNKCIIKFICSELKPGARILAKDPDAPPAKLVEILRHVCAYAWSRRGRQFTAQAGVRSECTCSSVRVVSPSKHEVLWCLCC